MTMNSSLNWGRNETWKLINLITKSGESIILHLKDRKERIYYLSEVSESEVNNGSICGYSREKGKVYRRY